MREVTELWNIRIQYKQMWLFIYFGKSQKNVKRFQYSKWRNCVFSLKVGVAKDVGQWWNTCFPWTRYPHPLCVQVYWNEFQGLLGFAAAWLERSTWSRRRMKKNRHRHDALLSNVIESAQLSKTKRPQWKHLVIQRFCHLLYHVAIVSKWKPHVRLQHDVPFLIPLKTDYQMVQYDTGVI